VFVYLGGGPEHVEVKVNAAGQSLAGLQQGRKAHFWWTAEDIDRDPGVAGVLRSLVPNVDRIWVGRDFGQGGNMQAVFDGTLVESGYDPTMVSLTALEVRREQPYPPIQGGGVREPVRPVPSGPGPVAAPPPPAAQPAQPSGETVSSRPADNFFVQARQAQQPVPLGSQAT
jgi:hypothetical protein